MTKGLDTCDNDGLYEDWLNEQDAKLTKEEYEKKYPFLKRDEDLTAEQYP